MVYFSDRMEGLRDVELLRLMELAEAPNIISFAGGFPSSDLFPVEEMDSVTRDVFANQGESALQYASTTGYEPLRTKISDRMNRLHHLQSTEQDIIITSGSQQSLDMLGMIFINPGDGLLVESPSYIGAINAFKAYSPKFIEVPTEEDGMDTEALRRILENRPGIRMIYVIPDFQNPTGRVWSVEKRKAFMKVVKDFDVVVVEDTAYYDLSYEEIERPSLTSLDKKGQVIFLGTFSKIFCPGLRVGWVYADRQFLDAIRLIKPNVDLSSSSIAQRQIDRYMDLYDLEAHIKKVIEVYKKRSHMMQSAMKAYFPDKVSYREPKGGLFYYAVLPENKSARELLQLSLKAGVAFVPGGSFYANSKIENTMRLNFSFVPENKIREGIEILGGILKEYLD